MVKNKKTQKQNPSENQSDNRDHPPFYSYQEENDVGLVVFWIILFKFINVIFIILWIDFYRL